jgi:hypothetical protein
MATVREEIQTKIDAIKAKATADVAELEAHLNGGGNWLDQEFEAVKLNLEALIVRIREKM